ncbi:MAG: peptidylprolyl isomerase [Sinobacterium sp.]|nr:peptidylprolyl isomerase [Sinobacterium sp.]
MPRTLFSATRKLATNSLLTISAITFSAQLLAVNTLVEIETNKGSFTLELYDEKAPETVKNFLSYVDDGFYEGTIFHRLIPGFMLQGGGFTKELTKKETRAAIKNEASDELKNVHGSVAMARTSSPNSATSQFFINFADNTHLDYKKYNVGYAVFGQVQEDDLELVDALGDFPTGTISIHRDVPKDAIIINKISRVKVEAEVAAEAETTDAPATDISETAPTE